MKQDEAIIFDLDGTLTNTLPLAVKGSNYAVKKACGLDLTIEEIQMLFGKTEEGLFRHYCGDKWEEGVKYYKEFFEENVTPAIIFDGMADVLNYLKQNKIKMSLVTGRGPDSTEVILRKTGLAQFFDYVKTGSPKGSIKAQCMAEVLALWKQPADKTFYIGDVTQDVIDSKEAGLTPLSCAWFEKADKAALAEQKPYKIFDSIAEFFTWIKNN